eukprot:2216254-Pyramimonas_sp.AAC.1
MLIAVNHLEALGGAYTIQPRRDLCCRSSCTCGALRQHSQHIRISRKGVRGAGRWADAQSTPPLLHYSGINSLVNKQKVVTHKTLRKK